MKTLKIGILAQEQMRARVLAIASGEYKPEPGEPSIWFPSMKSLAEVLSDDNRALLKLIEQTQPESMTALAHASGRALSNLSRTLKTMAGYGLVEMQRDKHQVRPIAKATAFQINTD